MKMKGWRVAKGWKEDDGGEEGYGLAINMNT